MVDPNFLLIQFHDEEHQILEITQLNGESVKCRLIYWYLYEESPWDYVEEMQEQKAFLLAAKPLPDSATSRAVTRLEELIHYAKTEVQPGLPR
jgi:hypothetical protein